MSDMQVKCSKTNEENNLNSPELDGNFEIKYKLDSVKLRKENKILEKRDLEQLSKQELINKVLCLESHNIQLKNIIQKKLIIAKAECKKRKPFDFSRTKTRHILLKFYYLGWDYQGFATQEDTLKTIEHHLFQALLKTCLIKDRESSNYHRCGRTDKGVSSFGQVISIDVRSKLAEPNQENTGDEINYCKVLNRVLPESIQCVCWCPVDDNFSARFDCKRRTYKYFFPKSTLNIDAMKIALKHLIGTHDFRNFCKMDVANGVVNFTRNVLDAQIEPCDFKKSESEYSMYQLTIIGQAFLWHQIRCITAILFLIGENKEIPEVIKELLDVKNNPRKPDYNLASDIPLNLFHCEYEGEKNWVYDQTALFDVISGLQKFWTLSSVKTTMVKSMLDELENIYRAQNYQDLSCNSMTSCLINGVKSKVYKPLMKRQKCGALEDKIQHYIKKNKLIVEDSELSKMDKCD